MEISNSKLVGIFVLTLALLAGTLWNIHTFMPIAQTCEDEFALINECGCVPCDSPLLQFFNDANANKICEVWVKNLTLDSNER